MAARAMRHIGGGGESLSHGRTAGIVAAASGRELPAAPVWRRLQALPVTTGHLPSFQERKDLVGEGEVNSTVGRASAALIKAAF